MLSRAAKGGLLTDLEELAICAVGPTRGYGY